MEIRIPSPETMVDSGDEIQPLIWDHRMGVFNIGGIGFSFNIYRFTAARGFEARLHVTKHWQKRVRYFGVATALK
mgnify:CR=1 FL=1|jgi:hypothetical protein